MWPITALWWFESIQGNHFMAHRDKSQRKAYNKQYAKDRRFQAQRRYVLKRYYERRQLLDAIKLHSGCADCGYNRHAEALHFDHKDPAKKSFRIAGSISKPWEKVLAEIAKCEVRCANCHAVRTVREGHHKKSLVGSIGCSGDL